MNIAETTLEGVLVIEPDVFSDTRGAFLETYHKRKYAEHGISVDFVQDNLSVSRRGTLRGLHYQLPDEQAKLVQVLRGTVVDVVVDIRRGSPTFGRVFSAELSEDNRRQCFVPAGMAHGFCVLSGQAVFHYKCSAHYAPSSEKGMLWSDPDLEIQWPVEEPVVSSKDRRLPRLRDIAPEDLPVY